MNKQEETVMKRICFLVIPLLAFISALVPEAHGQMQSENYAITTSVFSSGGAPSESGPGEPYKQNSILGQSSPIMDPELPPPGSDNYWLYPGFLYTLEPGIAVCDLPSFASDYGSIIGNGDFSVICDTDADGDVDGLDLADFVADFP
jgi:hypothetical protein